MTTHAAETIVAAAVTALTGLATTGGNVFPSRAYPLETLPALLVDMADETSDVQELQASPLLMRNMELTVTAVATDVDPTTLRATINSIRAEVEVAIAANQNIGGAQSVLLSGNTVELVDEQQRPVMRSTMRFNVQYFTQLNAPGTAV